LDLFDAVAHKSSLILDPFRCVRDREVHHELDYNHDVFNGEGKDDSGTPGQLVVHLRNFFQTLRSHSRQADTDSEGDDRHRGQQVEPDANILSDDWVVTPSEVAHVVFVVDHLANATEQLEDGSYCETR